MNAAQHKIVNLLKTFFLLISFCLCINVWPRDAKRLDARQFCLTNLVFPNFPEDQITRDLVKTVPPIARHGPVPDLGGWHLGYLTGPQ